MTKLEGIAYKLATLCVDRHGFGGLDRDQALEHLAAGFGQTLRTVEGLDAITAATAPTDDALAVIYRMGELA